MTEFDTQAYSGGPQPGFYPDPAIPGYLRYWDGEQWVPATSRPAEAADSGPSQWEPPPAPGTTVLGRPYASLAARLLARIIDAVVTTLIFIAVTLPLTRDLIEAVGDFTASVTDSGSYPDGLPPSVTDAFSRFAVWGSLAGFVIAILYEVVPTYLWGRTLGKHLVGIRVLSMAEGQPPTLIRSFLRYLVLSILGIIAILWILFDRPHRQGLHDKVADTVVVKG